jgi:hypothetical protein
MEQIIVGRNYKTRNGNEVHIKRSYLNLMDNPQYYGYVINGSGLTYSWDKFGKCYTDNDLNLVGLA